MQQLLFLRHTISLSHQLSYRSFPGTNALNPPLLLHNLSIGQDEGGMDEARYATSLTYAISRFFRRSGNLPDNVAFHLHLDQYTIAQFRADLVGTQPGQITSFLQ
jgi:hypothetical protein